MWDGRYCFPNLNKLLWQDFVVNIKSILNDFRVVTRLGNSHLISWGIVLNDGCLVLVSVTTSVNISNEKYTVLYQRISWPLVCRFQITVNMSFVHFKLHNLDGYKRSLVNKQAVKPTVVHDMTLCKLVDSSQRVGWTSCLSPQGRNVNRKFHPISITAVAKIIHFWAAFVSWLASNPSPCPLLHVATSSFAARLMLLAWQWE